MPGGRGRRRRRRGGWRLRPGRARQWRRVLRLMRARRNMRRVARLGKPKNRCVINAAFSVVRTQFKNQVDLPAYSDDSRSMSVCLGHNGRSTRLKLSKGVPVHEGEPETSGLPAHPIQRRLCLSACLRHAAGREADCSSLAHHRFLKHPQRSVSIRVRFVAPDRDRYSHGRSGA